MFIFLATDLKGKKSIRYNREIKRRMSNISIDANYIILYFQQISSELISSNQPHTILSIIIHDVPVLIVSAAVHYTLSTIIGLARFRCSKSGVLLYSTRVKCHIRQHVITAHKSILIFQTVLVHKYVPITLMSAVFVAGYHVILFSPR